MNPILWNTQKIKEIKPAMTFSAEGDYTEQKKAILQKFKELIHAMEPLETCSPRMEAVDTSDPRFDEVRFSIETEPDFFVPAHLIYPKNTVGKIPLVICLQGHSAGMHVSLAREKFPSKEPMEVQGDRDFCIQAVARGYAALALEQRGFGELNSTPRSHSCRELSRQALLMGKTLLAQRLYDISNAITAVITGFDFIDASKIGIMGNSGGGTSSYYVACLDERIKVSMPSSSFCSIVDSWGALPDNHCDCAYIPGIPNYFEMADLSILIAPRYLIPVNGIYDHIQPYEAAKQEFERVKEIYEIAGAKDHCQLVTGPEGHRFYADLSWDIFDQFINA